ncbi:hypothetical protein M409DRAFT_25208 [Zasmidium cellare ATCC 36951]|uniref:Uncharacterized protein n=1 Tax=Zasmidium cellare ATCC 36951 TaxID=1080233 RepID=A0A6A6CF75_ZASCE|nr:uncharacterized protein M409DRAFT_25208 [Zasmidium cellare ATCC 36951]KAF2164329.1 hypothetical protein M409DRAFT_25208 [Zasmidium cellare ATCC 36951]
MTDHASPLAQTMGAALDNLITLHSADDASLTPSQLIIKFLTACVSLAAVFTAFYYVFIGAYSLVLHLLGTNYGAGRLPGTAALVVLCVVALALFWAGLFRARVGVMWTGVVEERVRRRRDEEYGGDGEQPGRAKAS